MKNDDALSLRIPKIVKNILRKEAKKEGRKPANLATILLIEGLCRRNGNARKKLSA